MAITIRKNIPLAPYTVYKIGGPARFFIEASAKKEIIEAAAFVRAKRLPFFILGAGSNVLISDAGYNGVIIRIAGGETGIDGSLFHADPGVMMARAAHDAMRNELAGFEWAVGIPGTIGGSIRGNAGCFGGEMKDVIKSVEVFDAAKGTTYAISRKQCAFAYRDSIFKHHPEWVILSAVFELRKGNLEDIQKKTSAIAAERRRTQDIGTKSCGCIFKNFMWGEVRGDKERLLKCFPEFEQFRENETLPASFVIDQAGWKGKAIGRVRVSKKHANFFVNEGGASAEEAVMLISAVKNDIMKKYGLFLKEEMELVGF